ncbi:MAG: hypothetical protein ACSHYF_09895 [Verrucomicrobiaceae bacterium]
MKEKTKKALAKFQNITQEAKAKGLRGLGIVGPLRSREEWERSDGKKAKATEVPD